MSNPSEFEKFLAYTTMRKARNRWRWMAVIAIVILTISYVSTREAAKTITGPTPHIARIVLEGMILESTEQTERMLRLAENKTIKGVIVEIDSPGGTMTGGLSVYENLRTIAKEKPVVAVMKTVAASGGYLAALGADHIIANEATVTGSIGVLMPLIDATELAEKIGIKADTFASGQFKANTSPIEERTAADRAYLIGLVNELNSIFYTYVQERRPNMTNTQINTMRDGRAVVGTQALELNLVDALGSPQAGKTWLIQQAELMPDIPVRDYDLYEPVHWLEDVVFSLLPPQLQNLATVNTTGPAIWAVLQ